MHSPSSESCITSLALSWATQIAPQAAVHHMEVMHSTCQLRGSKAYCCAAQKPILIDDYSNLYNVNGKALSSGGVG